MVNQSSVLPGFNAESALLGRRSQLFAGTGSKGKPDGIIQPSLQIGGGGGAGKSCTAKCTDEKESCRQGCDASDGGYFCYFDCRLSYMACLAGCITHGISGGVGGILV